MAVGSAERYVCGDGGLGMEAILFLFGGQAYIWIEILWRGHSHWSMFILGGLCFVIMGLLNEYRIPWHWCLLRQAVVSACIITVFEFITGCVVNLLLKWDVWDYSGLPFNLCGQVCLYYFLLWIPLSVAGIMLDDWIRYLAYLALHNVFPKMQKRKRPHYKFA